MRLLLAVAIAAFYGLTIRLLYGLFGGTMGVMSLSFFFLTPFLIGYLTIFVIPYKEHQTGAGAFFKPWLTVLAILGITSFFNIEGMICWIMAFPIFAVLAGLGGLLLFNRKRRRALRKVEWDFEKEDWNKPGNLKISFLLFVPILAGLLEGDRTTVFKELTVGKHLEIKASPGVVWNAVIAKDGPMMSRPHTTLATMMGFPHHLTTTVDRPAVGGARVARYERGLTFVETIKRLEPGRLMAVVITTDPSKISKAIMDEHIVIGGKHIRLLEDVYTLNALPDGNTELVLSSRFSINTPFNWYAGLWSRLLMSDVLIEELRSIKAQSEK
jgi:hypothetical protein